MKNYLIIFILGLLTLSNLFGAKITDDVLKVGIPGSAADKTLYLGDNRLIRSNETTGAMEFTNDAGTLWKKIGSGSGAGGSGGVNVLLNSGAEDGLVNWTNSGGTFTQQSYTEAVEGDAKFFRFVATASGQYVETDLTTFPDFITGGCMADIKYIQGDNVFILKVIDQVPADISTGILSDLTEWIKGPTQAFNCPTQGKLRIESTAAGTIDFDDAYLGSNKGFIDGSYRNSISLEGNDGRVITANTESMPFDGTGNGWTSGVDGSTHENGNFYTVQRSNSVINITVANRYTTSNTNRVILYKDGVLYKNIDHTLTDSLKIGSYNSSIGEFALGTKLTFGTDGSLTLLNQPTDHYLNIVETSNETQEAFTPEQADFFVNASITGGTLSYSNTSFAIISNASLTASIVGAASIVCSDGSQGSTTCSTGNEMLAMNVNIPRAGRYRFCTQASGDPNNATTFQEHTIIDPASPTTVLQTAPNSLTMFSATVKIYNQCSYFDISSIGNTGFAVRNRVTSGGANINSSLGVRMTIELVSHNVSRPIIQDMVTTIYGEGLIRKKCKINEAASISSFDDATDCSWISGLVDTSSTLKTLTWDTFPNKPTCSLTTHLGSCCSAWNVSTDPLVSGGAVAVQRCTDNVNLDCGFTVTCESRR